MGKFSELFSRSATDLVAQQEELWSAANSLAKYGHPEAASATLKLLACLRAFASAETELARVRDLLKSGAAKTRVPRFGPRDYVMIGRGKGAGQLGQVVLVRAGSMSGDIVYDLRIRGGLVQGTPEDWLCATIEEYALTSPLDVDV